MKKTPWRKRFISFIIDGINWMGLLTGTFFIGTVFYWINLYTFCHWFSWDERLVMQISYTLTFFVLFAICVKYETVIEPVKKDERIIEGKAESNRPVETLKIEKDKISVENEKVKKSIENIIQTIHDIQDTCPIDEKEKHYLLYSLPNNIRNIIEPFCQLASHHQKEMEANIINLLEQKKKELIENYIDRNQNNLKKQIEQNIRIAETIKE